MKKQNLDNKTLDAIGRNMLKGANMPSTEIDHIVSNPGLFDLVNKRIAAQAELQRVEAGSLSVVKKIAFAGIPAAALVAAAVSASLITSENPVSEAGIREVPLNLAETARPEIPPQGTTEILSAGRAQKTEIRAQKASKRDTPTRRKGRKPAENVPDAKFYAIAHPGEITGGRILRVDLDRTSAFALGVDLPLENGAPSIKADLLVGSDGVTRAIRVLD